MGITDFGDGIQADAITGTSLVTTTVNGTTVTGTTLVGTNLTLNTHVASPVVVSTTVIDASAGGTATETAVVTVPADSILMDVTAECTAVFNGDTTTTLEVGLTGNIDKYIDTVDLDVTGLNQASMINGTTNDQVQPEYLAASTAIVATWTNTASATTGSVTVRVVYIPLA